MIMIMIVIQGYKAEKPVHLFNYIVTCNKIATTKINTLVIITLTI